MGISDMDMQVGTPLCEVSEQWDQCSSDGKPNEPLNNVLNAIGHSVAEVSARFTYPEQGPEPAAPTVKSDFQLG